jgi:hypothetical protein
MGSSKKNQKWAVLGSVMRLSSPWLELIVERLLDSNNKEIEYWRVEKPSGILIIVIQGNKILLPQPFYRPGIQRQTLDLCGGRRINPGTNKSIDDAKTIVKRELKINDKKPFNYIKPLNKTGWYVDSSFTNTQLDVFIAELAPSVVASNLYKTKSYQASPKGISKLLGDIKCAQCRLALREWQASLVGAL